MPVISVIVPIYNQDKYLKQCVDSILCQSFSDIEIILVDDGSTDQSGVMCDSYAKQDMRIKVIHKENGGLSDARNAGIELAGGEYIAFVDSDDFVAKNIYEKLYQSLIETDADIAVCNCLIVDEKGQAIPELNDICVLLNQTYTGKQIVNGEGTYWLNVVAWNKVYKRNLFAHVRYPKGKYHEDEFIFHELYDLAKKVVCISDKMYFYRKTGGTITDPKNVIFRLDRAEAMYNRIKYCIQKGYVKKILEYERVMFMPLEIVARRGMIKGQNKEKFDRVKRLNKVIVKQLYGCRFISLKMLMGRYMFYLFPGMWWLDQCFCRIRSKLKNN